MQGTETKSGHVLSQCIPTPPSCLPGSASPAQPSPKESIGNWSWEKHDRAKNNRGSAWVLYRPSSGLCIAPPSTSALPIVSSPAPVLSSWPYLPPFARPQGGPAGHFIFCLWVEPPFNLRVLCPFLVLREIPSAPKCFWEVCCFLPRSLTLSVSFGALLPSIVLQ